MPDEPGDDLKIEVMQLSSPSFARDSKLPTTKSSNPALKALNTATSFDDKLLLLPYKLVVSHLGEPFRICCAIRRKSNLSESQKILDLDVHVTMTTSKSNHKVTLFKSPEPVALLEQNDASDFVAVHDLRSSGEHRLEIYCNYTVQSVSHLDGSSSQHSTYMRKVYNIQVETPIKIMMNYPYLNTRTCMAEATIENISSTDVNLTQFLMEPTSDFKLLEETDASQQFYLRPQEKASRTFLLSNTDESPLKSGKHKFGRLNIMWRRGITCLGRLQTAPLVTERKPEFTLELRSPDESKTIKQPSPTGVALLKPENIEINLVNTTDAELTMDLALKANEFGDALKFIGALEHNSLTLKPGEDCVLNTKYISTRRGVFTIPTITCLDLSTNHVYKFTNIKKVLVS